MVHVEDIGVVITFETGEDLSLASTHELIFKKPDKTTGTWAATVSGTKLLHTSVVTDFDQAGRYEVQAYVITPSWTAHSEVDSFDVYANLA